MMEKRRTDLAQVFDSQSEIIKLQSEIIDELFCVVCQYITAEELVSLSAIEKIDRAARIKAHTEREG
ncbi:MAG: hypothetical protein E7241_04970 [Lachnospiraceae bacterium]|nr:hypothetical protein [Lachnospiraceae bacterium]